MNYLNHHSKQKKLRARAYFYQPKKIKIINVYRAKGSPSPFISRLTGHISDLTSKHQGFGIMVIGDFNLDLLHPDPYTESLIDTMIDLNFLQRITELTQVTYNSSKLIDHIYTKCNSSITTDLIESDLSDHRLNVCKLKSMACKSYKEKITKRWFTPESYENIKIFLKYENWDSMKRTNVNEAAGFLQGRIKQTLDILVPIETRELGAKKNKPVVHTGH